jgi:bacterioferritin
MPKGNEKIIYTLNQLLVMEITGRQQYLVNRARYFNLQLMSLVTYIDERIADETRHIDMLLDRILYLQGVPVADRISNVAVMTNIDGTFQADKASEQSAITAYNDAILKAVEAKDDGTRALLETILRDEEDHINDLEAKLDQVALVGLPMFLAQAIKE